MTPLSSKLMQLCDDSIAWYCPGCRSFHRVAIRSNDVPRWTFNNNPESPTFSPSVLTQGFYDKLERTICHCFIKDGNIEFLNDSTHELSGQTIPIPDWPF